MTLWFYKSPAQGLCYIASQLHCLRMSKNSNLCISFTLTIHHCPFPLPPTTKIVLWSKRTSREIPGNSLWPVNTWCRHERHLFYSLIWNFLAFFGLARCYTCKQKQRSSVTRLFWGGENKGNGNIPPLGENAEIFQCCRADEHRTIHTNRAERRWRDLHPSWQPTGKEPSTHSHILDFLPCASLCVSHSTEL